MGLCNTSDCQTFEKEFQIDLELFFACYLISEEGFWPDPKCLEAIKEFVPPKDIHRLHSFLELVNQLGQFLPDLAKAMEKIQTLFKKLVF